MISNDFQNFLSYLNLWYLQHLNKMKGGDSLMSNIDQIIILNENQAKKIKFLQKQKKNYEKYVKDLRETLALNKQSLSQLASSNKYQSIRKLNEENIKLHSHIARLEQESLNFSATLLIEEQLRNQEKKFYNERLIEYQNTMNELRKYLQDKEDSFSAIVIRLRKYEDVNDLMLSAKLEKFKKELREGNIDNFLQEVIEQRDKYKQIFEEFKVNLRDIEFLKSCLHDEKSYEQMQKCYKKLQQQFRTSPKDYKDKYASLIQKTKNATNASINLTNSTQKINPVKEIICLLKKQKLNNEILQQALNEAIEKNEELIQEINVIVQTNLKLEETIQKLESKIVLLERELSIFTNYHKQKLNIKSKCDLNLPLPHWLQHFEERGDEEQIHLESLKEDVQKLNKFIFTCLPPPSRTFQKSYSSHNLYNKQTNEHEIIEEGDIEIEQIN